MKCLFGGNPFAIVAKLLFAIAVGVGVTADPATAWARVIVLGIFWFFVASIVVMGVLLVILVVTGNATTPTRTAARPTAKPVATAAPRTVVSVERAPVDALSAPAAAKRLEASDAPGGLFADDDLHGLRTRRARAYVMDNAMYGPVVGDLFAMWDEKDGILVDGEVVR